MKTKKNKILIALGALIGFLAILILALPFLIDVDKYRPQIVDMANEKMNGKLSLGKMKLSLWGQIKVEVDGMELTDPNSNKILSVKDVYFHVPFSSVFGGSPLITLKLQEPEIRVIKNKQGKMNAMEIVKKDNVAQQPTTDPQTTAAPSAKAISSEPPSFVKKARFGLEIRKASLVYRDEVQNLDSKITDLNFLIKDLSMERPSQIEFWATLDTKMGKSLSVTGPVKANATVSPEFKGTEFSQAKVVLTASMDEVAIVMPDVFEKKSGVPANFKSTFFVTPTSLNMEQMECVFFNAKLEGKVAIKDIDKEGSVTVLIKSNDVELKPWGALLPSLKEHELSGTANFNAAVQGKMLSPQYQVEANLNEFKAKNPKLKVTPVIKAHLKVVTDKIEDLSFSLVAPGSQLEGKGTLENFKKPKLDFKVTSTGLDLDSFMDLKTAAESKTAVKNTPRSNESAKQEPVQGNSAHVTASNSAEEDMDILLDPLRQNEMAKSMVASIKVNFASLKAYDVKMTDINAAMSMKNLLFSIDSASMKLWKGEMKGKMAIEMLPKTPSYKFNFDVAHLNIQDAVESRFALFKNTLLGNANFNIEGNGQSFTSSKAKRNLNAKGNMSVKDATFATIDIVKVAGEGINKAISDKIPAAKDKKISIADNTQGKYTSVTSDFTISGGQFDAPNFVAKAEPNKGIDIKGNTQMGILDYALKANWELVDTYNVTHARDLSVEQNGVRVEHILADGNDPVRMPIVVEGTAFEPKVSYTAAFEALSKIAIKNIGNAVADRAKAEARKQVEEAAQNAVKQASPQVQDAIKNLGGKLFGN